MASSCRGRNKIEQRPSVKSTGKQAYAATAAGGSGQEEPRKTRRPYPTSQKFRSVEEKIKLSITEEMKKSFYHLRSRLLQAPILAYPRFNSPEPFILDTDWSQETSCIGGVLSQVQDGRERVIAYGAKKMSSAQENYAAGKGEVAAIYHFAEHWSYYLKYRPFIVRTDHKPLVHMEKAPTLRPFVQRWFHFLNNYQYSIQYRSGKSHGNADALSRAPHVAAGPPSKVDLGLMTR